MCLVDPPTHSFYSFTSVAQAGGNLATLWQFYTCRMTSFGRTPSVADGSVTMRLRAQAKYTFFIVTDNANNTSCDAETSDVFQLSLSP